MGRTRVSGARRIAPYFSRARTRVRCFSFFAFTSSPFALNVLALSAIRVKASPFLPSLFRACCLHLFIHRKWLFISGLSSFWGEEKKGEGFTRNLFVVSVLKAIRLQGEGKVEKRWSARMRVCEGA